jgi:uncharacterized protein (DUF58 family)
VSSEPTRCATRTALGSRLFLALGLGALLLPWLAPCQRGLALLAFNALVAGLFAYDRARLLASALELRRSLSLGSASGAVGSLRVRVPAAYTLELAHAAGPRLRLWVEERAPLHARVTPERQRLALAPGQRAALSGELVLERHGRLVWDRLWLRRESALGLCALSSEHTLPSEARAYPALPALKGGVTLLVPHRAGPAPAALRVAEQGGEIERLREYVSTDSMRSLDWKATAKRRRPITRAYQPERNQTLWIVLDASRAMMRPAAPPAHTARSAAATRFEAALEAALLLADAALSEGDRVGMLAYGRALKLCVTPRAGHAQLLALMQHSLSLHAEPTELDVAGLLSSLARCAPKRSLVVLFTDLDNEGDLRELVRHARLLARRHASLCVSLRPEQLASARDAPIEAERDLYRKLAAISLHEQRSQLARDLETAGLALVESALPQLGRAIVQRYRAEKTSGRV